jgi:NADPH2:quinone reductase
VKVHAASINPSDTKNIMGLFPHTSYPIIIGRDFSGTVISGGNSSYAQNLVKNNVAVYGTSGTLGFIRNGTHSQYIKLKCNEVAIKPKNLSFIEAASIGVSFVTAYSALHHTAHVSSKDVVMTNGSSGAVGNAVIQLSKLIGAKVISLDRSRPKSDSNDNNKKVTADYALYISDYPKGMEDIPNTVHNLPLFNKDSSEAADYHASNMLHSHSSWINNSENHVAGANVIVDVVGGDVVQNLLKCASVNGRYVNISTPPTQRIVPIDLFHLYRHQIQLMGANSVLLNTEECAYILNQLTPHFESGVLTPLHIHSSVNIFKTDGEIDHTNIAHAYEQVAQGARGKIVLVMNQDLHTC